MSNPFKKGDKLICVRGAQPGADEAQHVVGQLVTVLGVWPHLADNVVCAEPYADGSTPENGNTYRDYRAAIAGQDYPLPVDGFDAFITANSGHLSDGSSVQKHSAGALYPCVLVWRDAKLGGMVYDDFGALVPAKYDVGVISPRNPEPLWFSNFDRAVSVAATIKEDLQ